MNCEPTGANGYEWGNYDAPVTDCGDGTYCCGDTVPENPSNELSGSDCCAQKKGARIDSGVTSSSSSSTVLPSSTSASSTAALTGLPKLSKAPDPLSNTGAIAGGAVGGTAALVFLILVVWYFARFRRRRRHVVNGEGPRAVEMEHNSKACTMLLGELSGESQRGELYGNSRAELMGGISSVELDGR